MRRLFIPTVMDTSNLYTPLVICQTPCRSTLLCCVRLVTVYFFSLVSWKDITSSFTGASLKVEESKSPDDKKKRRTRRGSKKNSESMTNPTPSEGSGKCSVPHVP